MFEYEPLYHIIVFSLCCLIAFVFVFVFAFIFAFSFCFCLCHSTVPRTVYRLPLIGNVSCRACTNVPLSIMTVVCKQFCCEISHGRIICVLWEQWPLSSYRTPDNETLVICTLGMNVMNISWSCYVVRQVCLEIVCGVSAYNEIIPFCPLNHPHLNIFVHLSSFVSLH